MLYNHLHYQWLVVQSRVREEGYIKPMLTLHVGSRKISRRLHLPPSFKLSLKSQSQNPAISTILHHLRNTIPPTVKLRCPTPPPPTIYVSNFLISPHSTLSHSSPSGFLSQISTCASLSTGHTGRSTPWREKWIDCLLWLKSVGKIRSDRREVVKRIDRGRCVLGGV